MTERITMHEYRCAHCNFHWFQENYFASEPCIQCGQIAQYVGSEEQNAPMRKLS